MKSGNILVVEDERVSARVIEHQLRKLGYSVAGIATSGAQAVEFTERLKPDLILMDINLNGAMDGVEAAGIIRAKRSLPIIYLTASSDEKTINRALTTEAHGYLLKPLHERELHSALQMALYKAWMEANVRGERQWLSATLRCVTDGVIAADSAGAVKFANLAAERLTGWPERDALGRDLREVYRVLDRDTRHLTAFALSELIGEDRVGGVTSCKLLVSRQGTETAVEQNATLIVNEDGAVTGVVFVFRPLPRPEPSVLPDSSSRT